MGKFLGLLEHRHDQIDEYIFDILESFTEFSTFKQLMLEHKSYIQNEDSLKSLTIKSNRLS
jgi:hypothetical protein